MTFTIGTTFIIETSASSLFIRFPFIGQMHLCKGLGLSADKWSELRRTGAI